MKLKDGDIEKIEEREELFNEMIQEGLFSLDEYRRTSEGNFKYSLEEILLLWLCSMLCGFYSYRQMELYGKIKIDFLRRFFPYAYGIPSRSTVMRLIATICPSKMNDLLIATISNSRKETALSGGLETIALDGKTHCGTQITEDLKTKLHIVSAFDTYNGITLTQEKVPDKTNEISAMKTILSSLSIEGKTITIDAIGTQKEITSIVRKGKGNYILAVKENQKGLLEPIETYFGENSMSLKPYKELDKGHGRIEKRTIYAVKTPWFKGEEWVDLNTIIMVQSERIIGQEITYATRYYITNLNPEPKKLLSAIRAHWGIESAHWTLDMTFNEDDRIIWNRIIAHNESIAKRLIMNILKQFREVFSLFPKRKEKHSYKALQTILFAKDDVFEALLRGNFK